MPNQIVNRRLLATQLLGGDAWTPLSLPNKKLWVKSDTGITLNGAKVSAWADQSGNGNNLSQATDTKQPAYTASQLNGYPSVVFDGIDDYLQTSVFTLAQPETIFLVLKQITWTDAHRICDGIPNNTGGVFQFGVSPSIIQYAGNFGASVAELSVGTFGLMTIVFNSTSSSMQINNNTIATGDAGTSAMNGFTLAELGLPGLGLASNISVVEAIITSDSVSSANRTLMQQYVTSRYGISM